MSGKESNFLSSNNYNTCYIPHPQYQVRGCELVQFLALLLISCDEVKTGHHDTIEMLKCVFILIVHFEHDDILFDF